LLGGAKMTAVNWGEIGKTGRVLVVKILRKHRGKEKGRGRELDKMGKGNRGFFELRGLAQQGLFNEISNILVDKEGTRDTLTS